jgi:hypothetical protein
VTISPTMWTISHAPGEFVFEVRPWIAYDLPDGIEWMPQPSVIKATTRESAVNHLPRGMRFLHQYEVGRVLMEWYARPAG